MSAAQMLHQAADMLEQHARPVSPAAVARILRLAAAAVPPPPKTNKGIKLNLTPEGLAVRRTQALALIEKRRAANAVWTPERDALLRRLRAARTPDEETLRQINALPGANPCVSIGALRKQATKIGAFKARKAEAIPLAVMDGAAVMRAPAPAPDHIADTTKMAPPPSETIAESDQPADEAFRAAWADPALRREDVARRFGMRPDKALAHAKALGLGVKPVLRMNEPAAAPPPDLSALEPVDATIEDARDWLYAELHRQKLGHAEIEARLAIFTAPGLLAECNAHRLKQGLSPYRIVRVLA